MDPLGLLERAPLYERVMEVERYKLKFAAYLDLLARQWFNYEQITTQASNYHQLIAPYVSQSTVDKAFFGQTAWFDYSGFEQDWGWWGMFAGERSQFILDNLTEIP